MTHNPSPTTHHPVDYKSFLAAKVPTIKHVGIDVPPSQIHTKLFDWQRDCVSWALRLGKAALFEECGLGKTLQQLEWSRHIVNHTGGRVLILAPLAVAGQTIKEGAKIDIPVTYCRSMADVYAAAQDDIIITNYEMLDAFDTAAFAGVVLDESSILKAYTGAIKRQILRAFADTRYKLACTATPSPNDQVELGNHAEFLNLMVAGDMLTRWFINDTSKAQTFRLKKHAEGDFWQWVASWAVCISKPSDLGYSDEGYNLPPLNIIQHCVEVDHTRAHDDGRLFVDANLSATTMWRDKKATAQDRCEMAAEIANSTTEAVTVWCDTNQEADILKSLIPDAVEVRGNHSVKIKEERLSAFSDGNVRVMITKADIAGFGLNWQHCHIPTFAGVNYSFEKFYQALRRHWRFGQTHQVDAHVIYAESEMGIIEAQQAKQAQHQEMQEKMNQAMKAAGLSNATADRSNRLEVETDTATGYLSNNLPSTRIGRGAGGEGQPSTDNSQQPTWTLSLGDCVEETKKLPDNSIDFTIFSPPFSTLYTYSNSWADMGNCENDAEFFRHFGYLIPDLFRVTVPGRLCAVHLKDLQMFQNRDGAAGIRDFTGETRRAFTKCQTCGQDISDHTAGNAQSSVLSPQSCSQYVGWILHSKIIIWKDPVQEMQRTKTHGLLYKNLRERAEGVRQGMPEYVYVFRKWAEGMEDTPHVTHTREDFPLPLWQRHASPVWFDINTTRVLNVQVARGDKDEKHLCPLQLDVIERCIELWTNQGDLVFDPFAGIGSTGYCAVKMARSFHGIELKREYYEVAIRNLKEAADRSQGILQLEVA